MAYERPKTFKVAGGVPLPVNEQLDHYATLAGMGKNQFVALCIQLGLQAWRRIYEPEKLLDSDAWEKILRSYDEQRSS